MRLTRVALELALCAFLLLPRLHADPLAYPVAERVEQKDDYHGTVVADPYRWLEEDARTSQRVADWVAAENRVTAAFLGAIPERAAIEARLKQLWNYERISAPAKYGGRYFFSKNDGLQAQNVVYVQDSLAGEPRVVFDPNTWSKDGTVALAGTSHSHDGRWVAYSVSEAGSDWQKWRIRDVDAGQDLPETIEWIKFSSPAWAADDRGFFYGRYEAPKPGEAFQAVNKFEKLYYHRLNTPQAEDVLVYHRPDQPDWGFGPTVTEDGRYLLLTVSKSSGRKYMVLVRDLHEPYAMPAELVGSFDAEYDFVGNDGTRFYFKTDVDAARGRLVAFDIRRPQRENWQTVIPESKDTLRGVDLVGNLFVATYLKDAVTAVRLFDTAGKLVREVAFPGLGSAGGFGGRRTDTETFYSFSSFAQPPTTYRYDLLTGESTLLRRPKVDLNPDDFEAKQVFFSSKDGTKIPMFVCHKKGLALDGARPTLLYAYGGFSISMLPSFSITRVAWMEQGGVFAMPNLRGGGEYGEEWHQAGTKLRKQNVFDDFIAAAEWLVTNGYTRADKLAIQGGSNGGLLIGACMTQRPELYGACLPAVGVMDMLRFHKFTIGWAWKEDYGSSDDPEQFKALYAYSPYHNIKDGVKYPATLITTADTDDRVVPGHSFKFAAALQRAQAAAGGTAPTLIRIETRAGHGGGKPTMKQLEEVTDQYAFLVKALGMTWK